MVRIVGFGIFFFLALAAAMVLLRGVGGGAMELAVPLRVVEADCPREALDSLTRRARQVPELQVSRWAARDEISGPLEAIRDFMGRNADVVPDGHALVMQWDPTPGSSQWRLHCVFSTGLELRRVKSAEVKHDSVALWLEPEDSAALSTWVRTHRGRSMALLREDEAYFVSTAAEDPEGFIGFTRADPEAALHLLIRR